MAGDGLHTCLSPPSAEPRDLVGRMRRRAPHPRALREHLHRVPADLLDAVDRLRDAPGRGDVGAEEHALRYWADVRPRPHGPVAHRLPPHRRCAHVPLQLALRARARRGVPAPDREHGHEPRGLRVRRADRALAALARDRVGRRDDVPARRHGAGEGGSPPPRCRRIGLRGRRGRSGSGCRTRAATGWDDAIKGRIEVPNAELEDLVLVRSDGRPTYNFASPLEDWIDGITHVIRGDDHVSNTPKQLNVLRALGAEPPVYAHVPNVFGADGKKLSKRHGAVSVDEFREAGYVPEALMNFLALLGWAPDGETTIMSAEELIERFSLERVGSSPATFDYAKLDWMNGVYLRALPRGRVRRTAGRVPPRREVSTGPRTPFEPRRPSSRRRSRGSTSSTAFAGFLFHDVEPDRIAPRRADPRRCGGRARRRRSVDGNRDRGGAEAALRRPGGEAAHGLSADPCRRHRVARLAGPLREPRAAREGDVARAAP